MSRRPKVQKSFSYSSEGDLPLDSPSESPIPDIGRTSGHRRSLRPFSNSRQQRRSSVFSSLLSFLRKPGSSTPEPPDDQPDSGDVEGDQQVAPSSETDLLDTSLSQKHEEAWTQACFNAVAFVFVFITGCICLAVYYVLEPFLHPLMWAVLIGMVLHPFKYAGTSQIKEWLTYLDTTGIPLSLGLVLSPVFIFNWLTQYFEYCFMSSWKTIFGLFALIVSLFLVYVLNLPLHAYKAAEDLMAMFEVLNNIMMERSYIQLGTLAIGFIILLVLTVRGSDYFAPIKVLSAGLWFLLMFNLGTFLIGSVALPLIVGIFSLAALIGKFCTSFKAHKLFEDDDDSEVSKMENGGEAPANNGSDNSGVLERGITLNTLRSMLSFDYDETDSAGQDQETQQDMEFSTTSFLSDEDSTTSSPYSKQQESTKKSAKVKRSSMKSDKEKKSKKSEMEEDTLDDKPRVSFGLAETVADLSPAKESDTLSLSMSETELCEEEEGEDVDGRGRPFVLSEMSAKERARARRQSNRVFIVLFTACFVVYVWRHPLLMLLFIPFGVWSGLKNAFNFAVARNSKFVARLLSRWSNIRNVIQTRRSILLPSPIPTIIQIYLAIDKKISNIVRSSIGSLLTTFIIVSLLIGMTTVTVLLLFEIQVEVMHYVTSALAVWNSTVADNQQINEWIGVEGNETTLTAIEKFANQNYAYGREWLTSQVRGLISDNSSTIEHHVVELYDQFYGYFVLNNSSAFATTPTDGVDVDGGERLSHDQQEGSLPWAELKELASNNLEIIISVLKSVWAIISKNMTVALSFLYTLLGVLFSGGSALINFVVFITALFYLLSYSEEQYLPMKWVTDFLLQISPGASPSSPSSPSSSGLTNGTGTSNTGTGGAGSHDHHEHGHAPIENAEIFSRIIRSVFHASFRRAFFYSLYTWLIHTIFGLSVSILPSVLAGIAGAMPFVGAYWVALPAVLELWLVEGQLLKALALMGLSLLPLFFVDTIINREIEGGHPYLTGLAIAGGIYFAGLEGALIGPILLCCLLFFIDFYSGLFNNS